MGQSRHLAQDAGSHTSYDEDEKTIHQPDMSHRDFIKVTTAVIGG
jgi:hypothetical protein